MHAVPIKVVCGFSLALLAVAAVAQTAKPPASDASEKWNAECSSCHMAYPPGLLPERSWRKMMGELDKHFGQSASLDDATTQAIRDYLVNNSAERNTNRRSSRFLRSIPASAIPSRITETAYFREKHLEVRPAIWKLPKVGSPANCNACHPAAGKGEFSDDDVKIPR